ncbi:MAG TPA: NAD-dependent epimerase/dehydratase family protein [Candidatus Hydrothermia bacterium]|nr:NAD-dependent epimerase/dehydratase family protein [Candidatus Hydrothermia bacterium]HOL24231.1 NAD-dependent epimerase/dehydratase family protein [Candidatus Hydrothermia bacterium]HPO79198.1 NAD-dependent epimerase/dehydratase family protein [Candidatus Hydrothermia bacterium]
MNIAVTGSTGFIGQNLVPELLRKGHKVRVLVRDSSKKIPWEEVEKVQGSFHSPESMKEFVDGIEAIVHCAGAIRAIKMDDFIRGNYTSTKNLVDAINQFKPPVFKKFIYLSSQSAQGPSKELTPRRVEQPPEPVSWYGKSKLMAENYIVNHLEYPYIILRLATVYGPGDRETLRFFKYVKNGIFPMPNGDKYLNMVYVKDVVKFIIAFLEMENLIRNKIYFVSDPEYHSLSEVIESIKSLLGKRTVIKISIPEAIFKPALKLSELAAKISGKPTIANSDKARELSEKYWTGDPTRTFRETGLRTDYNLMEGLFETLQWYKANRWL